MAETAKEIEQGLAFLRACNPRGPVYAALRPVLDDLQRAHASSSSTSSSAPAVTTALSAVEGIVVALHKAMVEEGFVCIVEKPSSVPGFAGTIRELLPHQLPDGWNSAQAAYALTYKHRLKAGKHFLLSGTVLADGALLATSVTEKGGHTAGTEFNVAEFAGVVAAAELKARLNALTRQLIPQLDPAAAVSSSSSSSSAAGMQQQQQPPPATPIFGGGSAGGSGGFPRIPVIPSVGSGDLHPALPGPGFGPDTGAGSLVGPGHPLFGADPYGIGGGGGGALGPTPPGWVPGLPRPRFDPYGPVPGLHDPGFGNPGFFPGGMGGGEGDPFSGGGPFGGRGGRGGRAGRGGRGPLAGWVPGEPNPDHLRPPQHDRHDFT